jgi:hypothetical protein
VDYSKLRAEIAEDPAGLGYAAWAAGGSDNAIAEVLNAPRYDALGKVGITPMLIWIAKYGIMARLRAAAEGDNAQIASIAEVAALLVQNPNIDAIDFGLPDVQAMLGALAQAGVIPAEAYQEVLTIARVRVSRADLLGLGTVSADDVSRAREG